ncbi:MAG: alkaline phosphatase family protein [Frankiaceae bacterium]
MRNRRVKPPKALVIGVDGGSLDVIEPLLVAGALPRLRSFLDRSAYGTSTTTWPAHTAPGWATFVTARQPGGHGIYQFFDTQDADYGDRILGSGDFGCSTAWEWLAAQGLSVGLINVPMSHPPVDLPGYQITWPLAPTLRYSRPATLLAELSTAGAPFASDLLTMYQGDPDYVDFAIKNVHSRGRSIEHLLRNRPVDVVMAVFTEVDRVCHHYWHFADCYHGRHDAAPSKAEWTEAIRATYVALDQVLGELLDLVGDETTVLMASDHGFGPGRSNVAVNAALEEAGLLVTQAGPTEHAPWFSGDGRSVDFTRTHAYMPTPGCYGVNVNLRGRQRAGAVGATETDRLTAELTDLFLDLTDPRSGTHPFAAVLPRAEAYPGAMTAGAPDLLLLPADEGVLADPHIGGPTWAPSQQTGMHRYEGMWALRSGRVVAGRRSTPIALHDLMPTLLHALDLRQPAEALGRPDPLLLPNSALPWLPDPAASAAGADRSSERVRDHELTAEILSTMGYL